MKELTIKETPIFDCACGHTPIVTNPNGHADSLWTIRCDSCKRTAMSCSKEDIITNWNQMQQEQNTQILQDAFNNKSDLAPRNGWAKGDYFRKCSSCGTTYIGDKRSVTCSVCAYTTEHVKGTTTHMSTLFDKSAYECITGAGRSLGVFSAIAEQNAMEAYKKGVSARKNGIVAGDNPYKEQDSKHWAWMSGWIDGIDPRPSEDAHHPSE